MSYEFTKLPEVEILDSLTDNAHLIVEDEGKTRRFPANQVGKVKTVNGVEPDMDGNIEIEIPVFDDSYIVKTVIIKDSMYDETVQSMQSAQSPSVSSGSGAPTPTYECINMTFEEAYGTMANGGLLTVYGMLTMEDPMNLQGCAVFAGTAIFGVPCIILMFMVGSDMIAQLFWTANSLSTQAPYD